MVYCYRKPRFLLLHICVVVGAPALTCLYVCVQPFIYYIPVLLVICLVKSFLACLCVCVSLFLMSSPLFYFVFFLLFILHILLYFFLILHCRPSPYFIYGKCSCFRALDNSTYTHTHACYMLDV